MLLLRPRRQSRMRDLPPADLPATSYRHLKMANALSQLPKVTSLGSDLETVMRSQLFPRLRNSLLCASDLSFLTIGFPVKFRV